MRSSRSIVYRCCRVPIRRRTWFGADAAVEVELGNRHRAGYGNLLVRHPGLINRLLRRGVPLDDAKTLELEHEFGHLQSLPLALGYGAMLHTVIFLLRSLGALDIFVALLSTYAAWEICAELYVMWHIPVCYVASYRGVSLAPRAIFWSFAVALASVAWLRLLPA